MRAVTPESIALLSALLGLPAVLCAEDTEVAGRPHILLITADDLGCQISCYGEKRYRTPQLDALAAQGLRFENFYVGQSSCSSSRATLLTGRWPHQTGQIGLAHLGFRMRPGQKNLPALLKAAGYRTGIIGKLHVEPAAEFPWDWMSDKKMAALPTRDVKWVAEQSRAFFASSRGSKQPFFCYVNYFDPHGPYTPDVDQVAGLPEKPLGPDSIAEPFPLKAPTDAGKKRVTSTMANAIMRFDAGLGLLLDELKASGMAENTLVVFLGDNGLPVVHGKTWSYEPGVRVPMIIRGPGLGAGRIRRDLACEVDLMPTILRAAGVAVPAEVEGVPLQQEAAREFLFTEMNFHEPQILRVQRTVRDARHKLMLNLTQDEGQSPVEMYDLEADPGETKNVADDVALGDARRRLENALKAWREKTADPMLDAARLQRWKDAAARWGKLPRVKSTASSVVQIPDGELDLLK